MEQTEQKPVIHLPTTLLPVLDGAQPLAIDDLITLARQRLEIGAIWLSRIIQPDGSFAYLYYPRTNRYDLERYNEVRHAGTTYALFQAAELIDDPAVTSCAESAATYIRDTSIAVPSRGKAFLHQGRMKLGGQALALVALLERRRVLQDRDFDDLIEDLATFMLGMELPDEPGRYHQSYLSSSDQLLLVPDSDYYPGEALLAFTRLAQHFPDGPWLAAAQRAASFLIFRRDGDIPAIGKVPRQDHWLAMALSDLYQLDENPSYATVAYMQADSMIAQQYPSDHPKWRLIGASRRGNSANYTSTATRAEALNAVWNLAAFRDDREAVERFSHAALRTIQFQMRVQYTAEIAANFPVPDRVIGAWAQDEQNPRIRVDFVQHNVSALIGARHLIEHGELPFAEPLSAPQPDPIFSPYNQQITLYTGPNTWAEHPVIHLHLETGPMPVHPDGSTQDRIDHFAAEIRFLLQPDSFVSSHAANPASEAADAGIAPTLAAAILAFQQKAGANVTHAGFRPGSEPAEADLFCEFEDETTARTAVGEATEALNRAIAGQDPLPDFIEAAARERDRLQEILDRPASYDAIEAEARLRGIPVRMIDQHDRILELGNGRYKRRFSRLATSNTSRLGFRIAGNKVMTNRILREHGLPVPDNVQVRDLEAAVAAAERIGYPVVLKPIDANNAHGVHIDVRTGEEVRDLFPDSRKRSGSGTVVIERYISGAHFRVLVIDDKVFAVIERVAAHVIGDGIHTIEELIEIENTDPRRGQKKDDDLRQIEIDSETTSTLERQGLSLETVLEAGRQVWIKRTPLVNTGGLTVNRTADIHPDNAEVARQAVMVVGLDLSGVDMVIPDISRSIWEVGGGIVEVNAAPGFFQATHPIIGEPRNVPRAVVEMLFPPDQPVRVPVIALAGSSDPIPAAFLIAHLLSSAGRTVGLASPDGIVIGNMPFSSLHVDAPHTAQIVLRNPTIDIAVLALTPNDLDLPGLPVDRIDTAAITRAFSFSPQHGLHNIDTILSRMVTPSGTTIVHADDLLATDLATETAGSVLVVSPTSDHPALNHHLESGGRAIAITSATAEPSLVERTGATEQILLTPDQLSLFSEQIDLDTLLFGIAVAITESLPPDSIASALKSLLAAAEQLVSQQ